MEARRSSVTLLAPKLVGLPPVRLPAPARLPGEGILSKALVEREARTAETVRPMAA